MRTPNGFTLIEALITVTISGILATIAVPSFAQLWRSQQLDSSTQMMLRSLALARQEAIKRGRTLTLANNAATWSSGWMLFQDDNNNGHYDPNELLLRTFPALPEGISLIGNTHVRSYIRYTANGRATLLNRGYQMGTLTACQAGNTRGNTMVLNNGGRVRQTSGAEVC
jgi:type IV fimbrial biogenesis protein FimT